jgi:hypothetical protein
MRDKRLAANQNQAKDFIGQKQYGQSRRENHYQKVKKNKNFFSWGRL